MVWKKIKQPTESISKRAVKVKNKPLFFHAHTRKSKELNQQKNCKITTKKKVNKSRSNVYKYMMEEN